MTYKLLFTAIALGLVLPLSSFTREHTTTTITNTATKAVQNSQPALIDTLEDGESYSIQITAVGCFSGARQTVVISKESGVFTAIFKNHAKVLTAKELDRFRAFENRLRIIQPGGCTTVDTYVLTFKDQQWRTSDGTCSWNGGTKLLKMFAPS